MITKKSNLLILFFMIWQILVDNLKSLSLFSFDIFGISIYEIINLLLISFMLYDLYKNKSLIFKDNKTVYFYFGLLFLYLFAHGIYILQLYDFSKYNFFLEIYYISRTYILPLLFLLILLKKNLVFKQREIISTVFTLLVSTLIVLLNVIKIALPTYEANLLDSGSKITYNIFQWFTYSSSIFESLASKGFFFSGNGVAAILFFTFPLVIYNFYKTKRTIHLIALVLQIIAMYMIGTTVSTFGIFIVIIVFIVHLLILKHENLTLKIVHTKNILLCLCLATLFIYSPVGRNLMVQNQICFFNICKVTENEVEQNEGDIPQDSELNNKDFYSNEELALLPNDEFLEAIRVTKVEYLIPDTILETYPLEENISFWKNVYFNEIRDWRHIKNLIYLNEIEKNGFLSNLFGIGYTSGLVYNEQDYLSEYYYYGIIGLTLLLGIYIYLFIYTSLKYLLLLKHDFKFYLQYLMIALSATIALSIGIFSGHVFYQPLTFYAFVFVIYNYYQTIKEIEEEI